MRFVPSLAALAASLPAAALACGGFFCQIVPVEQNAERILFEVDPSGTTTVVVDIRYSGEPDAFSWVVPVPVTPALDVAPPSSLALLDGATGPMILAPPTKCTGGVGQERALVGASGDDDDVNVEDLPQVGPFDPEVVSSDDPAALIDWLNENGYLITAEMEPLIASYVQQGLKFLAMKLAPDAGVGDITPIAMSYTASPMIPLSLTAVAAEPEMGVIVFVAASERWQSSNYMNLTLDPADVQANPVNGQTNYFPLISWLVDEAGGRAFVTQFADTQSVVSDNVAGVFLGADDEEEARTWVNAVLARRGYLTRLYTRVSAVEMTIDPQFQAAPDSTPVSRVIDLSDRPAVETCGPDPAPVPCGSTYCGPEALCATTDAGVDGCVCAEGSTGRVIREPARPGGPLVETVTCQSHEIDMLASVTGSADGPVDPCLGMSCGDFGTCTPVNGFATCACDEGYAAVPRGDGTAVCAKTRRTFDASQLRWTTAGCSCDAAGHAGGSLAALTLVALVVGRRRRPSPAPRGGPLHCAPGCGRQRGAPMRLVLSLLLCASLGASCATSTDDDDATPTPCTGEAGSAEGPDVEIVTPADQAMYDGGDVVSWFVRVNDPDTAAADLSLVLEDMTTGVPDEIDADLPAPDADGELTFSFDAALLGAGTHPVRLTGEDPEGCTGRDQVLVCIDQASCP
jgi:MYXO-CTERM domain-containing protein